MKRAALVKKTRNWRYRYERSQGEQVWGKANLLSPDSASEKIATAIAHNTPFLAGKIGSNEQLLILWAAGIPIDLPLGLKWRVSFQETDACATNAGVQPYTQDSYRELHKLFVPSLGATDLLGLFKLPREQKIRETFAPNSLVCQQNYLTPFFANSPWTQTLASKRVFLVSPFLDLFRKQLKQRNLIWPHCEFLPDLSIDGYQFPYLIDPDCHLSWQLVYQDVLAKMRESNFDVALFGCGALGFPLAYQAKRLGKVGIHLGGPLQLLFGISGKRYKQHPYYSQYINDHWISPPKASRPSNYTAVEDGCYW